jgi:sulfite reductase (NADPH) hemoprotein beta-component
VAPDEIADPRPYCEILRQWSTLHPEFAFLPRKFKIAVSGSTEDRVASGWYDIGLHLVRDEAGELGLRVMAGGGMGRTPLIGSVVREFLPLRHMLHYTEAILRVYNLYGRRDNLWKARIKILVRSEGQRFVDAVEREFATMLERDLGAESLLVTEDQVRAMAAHFEVPPEHVPTPQQADEAAAAARRAAGDLAHARWLERNVHAHRLADHRVVTLSLKRPGRAPGDATAQQMRAAAALAERFGRGELRVSHEQNLVLPWVHESELALLWEQAREAGMATPNIGLLGDIIACPGGDFCSLANARSLPVAEDIAQRFQDLDEMFDIGDLDLNISGCINSCGHHHSGHIGILGVDKDGAEWYQITVGGGDGSTRGGSASPGRIIGASFAADEVADAVEALIDLYREQRQQGERFIDTARRLGPAPFAAAADAVRRSTARKVAA